jgi:hypothetical protein
MTGVGLSITEMGALINNLFVGTLFGNLYLVGLLITSIIFLWIAIYGRNAESVVLVGMSALILYFSGTEIWSPSSQLYLPQWVGSIIIAVMMSIFVVGSYRAYEK